MLATMAALRDAEEVPAIDPLLAGTLVYADQLAATVAAGASANDAILGLDLRRLLPAVNAAQLVFTLPAADALLGS